MLDLVAATDLGWSAGILRPRAVAQSPRRVAIASSASPIYRPGRLANDGLHIRHRVTVYDHARRLIDVLDVARYPVNDLAWSGSRLAIATGSYDGGAAFEGELLVWDVDTGEVRRPLAFCREVRRVQWRDDAILALLAPDTDEDDAVYEVLVPDVDRAITRAEDPRVRVGTTDWAPPAPPPWPVPGAGPIQDVCFVPAGVVATGPALCTRWDRDLRHPERTDGPDGFQLLHVGGRVLVVSKGALHTLDGAEVCTFEKPRHCSTDGHHILARDVSPDRRDQVLDAAGATVWSGDLGHFDLFNHGVRVDGGLWFLRGTPKSDHRRKCLVRIGPDGAEERVVPFDPPTGHHMSPTGCVVGDDLVVGYYVHHPHPGRGERALARLRHDGSNAWRTRLACTPVALAPVPDWGLVLVATLDGKLTLIDDKTGKIAEDVRLQLDGVDLVPTCLAVDGARAAVACHDGRVVMVALE